MGETQKGHDRPLNLWSDKLPPPPPPQVFHVLPLRLTTYVWPACPLSQPGIPGLQWGVHQNIGTTGLPVCPRGLAPWFESFRRQSPERQQLVATNMGVDGSLGHPSVAPLGLGPWGASQGHPT